jgi:phosphoribosylaminoimidazole carboxylase PurE protein
MGSESDLPVMREAALVLTDFGVAHETTISSAHRHPGKTIEYARSAAGRGLRVIIAGAGMAAHLAGVLASSTTIPVIGVPLSGSALQGLDALLATVQMPSGVPVATVALGGAKNAAFLAIQILALSDPRLASRLVEHREALKREIEAADIRLNNG